MLLGFVLFFFSIRVEFEFKACFFLFSLFWVLSVSFLSEQGVAGQESDPYTHTESSLPWECEESEEWGVDVGMLLHSRQLFSLQGHLVNGISPLSIKFVKQIGYGSGSVWKVVFRCVCVCVGILDLHFIRLRLCNFGSHDFRLLIHSCPKASTWKRIVGLVRELKV